MKITKRILVLLIGIILVSSCRPDDDNGVIPERDRTEVDLEDQQELTEFLQTHFWNYEEFANITPGEEFNIEIDVIDEANADKVPLINQVTSSVLNRNGFDYTIYTLKARQGSGVLSPTFADSALVSYKGFTLDREVFDSSENALWFDLPNVVAGFMEGISQFNEASSVSQNSDGTLSYNDSGVGAVFMPSGAGYFSRSQTGIPAYSPIIFTFELRKVSITDHDGDGILSIYEDLNNDRDVRSPEGDNTDDDFLQLPNGVRRTGFNYLDTDDDNDGVLTIDENADPNGDGNPNDALDSDGDGIPDYLDDNSQ